MRTNWPAPHNPYNAPSTPGYRILGRGEVLLKTDEPSYGGDSAWTWGTTTCAGETVAGPITNSSYRRALNIDDPYAPPPEEWIVPGYTVLTELPAKITRGEQYWDSPWSKWHDSNPCNDGYLSCAYVRRPIAAPITPPTTKPSDTIIVKVAGNQVLSKAVQELAFAAGYKWMNGSAMTHDLRGVVVICINRLAKTIHWSPDPLYPLIKAKYAPLFDDPSIIDPLTDMGKLIDLLNAVPPAPPAPVLKGLGTVVYLKDKVEASDDIVKIGYMEINLNMLREYLKLMQANWCAGSQAVRSVTLSHGLELSKSDIESIIKYVDAVNGREST